jgi:uncharacterized repeat protein (TIGR03806 family)
MRKSHLFFIPFVALLLALSPKDEVILAPKMHLSEYGFFNGNIADLKPIERVLPYEVNAPLFSDYAEKARFIYLPEGKMLQYDANRAFSFPVGAVIIKNFFYYNDASKIDQGRKIIETRLLIKEEKGWKALEYIWNNEQTDAHLEVTGATLAVEWMDKNHKKRKFEYIAPNQNQCKGCHSFDGQFTPLGTTARQLNKEIDGVNQLAHWAKSGWLQVPDDFNPEKAPKLANYLAKEISAEVAARSYLEGNCSHCHNPNGPASTSGMFLGIEENDPERLGIGKPPVAAGRGSGDRKYGIVPGKPEQSILVYRMESNDPGIRMPELGRQTAHEEGIALIKNWISQMK